MWLPCEVQTIDQTVIPKILTRFGNLNGKPCKIFLLSVVVLLYDNGRDSRNHRLLSVQVHCGLGQLIL